MWWAYRSSDSSRQCQQIDSTVLVSRITHSTHCTAQTPSSASLQDSQQCRSLFNNVWLEKCRQIAPSVWTQRRSRDFLSYGRKQVITGQHDRKTGSAAAQQATAMQLQRAAYTYAGTNSNWYKYNYVNQRPHWTYDKNSTVNKGRRGVTTLVNQHLSVFTQ